METKTITTQLKVAYKIFKIQGYSLDYKDINYRILNTYSNNERITFDLALHYFHITDIYFFQKAYSHLNEESKLTLFKILNDSNSFRKNKDFCKIVMSGFSDESYIQALEKLATHKNHSLTELFIKEDSNFQQKLLQNIVLLEAVADTYLNLEQQEKSAYYLKKIIELDKGNYVARYNLAIVYENTGEFSNAKKLFNENIIQFNHVASLARLLTIASEKEIPTLISKNQGLIKKSDETGEDYIDLYFSLGTAYDKLKNYALAFKFFKQANELASASYDNIAVDPIDIINKQEKIDFVLSHSIKPIFICGMFRSGSTLLEQILSSHTQYSSGGEVNFFTPKSLAACINNKNYAEELAKAYIEKMEKFDGGINKVINKLPDNYMYVSLIKSLFPDAKIIITEREIKDNCLSIYFQNLSSKFAYSTNLESIKEHYLMQKSVVKNWKHLYKDDIYIFNYENLIHNPKESIVDLCVFLDIHYEDAMLSFYERNNSVRTASYHQVREKLHSRSINRFVNYEEYIKDIF